MLAEVLLSRGRRDAQAQEPCQEILQGGGHWGWWEARPGPIQNADTAQVTWGSNHAGMLNPLPTGDS